MPTLKYWDGAAWKSLVGGGGVVVYEQPGDPGVSPVGTIWIDTDEAPITYPAPPLVTSLPATPIDGQEAILTDNTNNPSYTWRLRYNAGSSSAYKWEFMGGAAMRFYSGADENLGATTATWMAGPTFAGLTVPRAGEYRCSFSTSFYVASAATTYCGVGAASAPTAPWGYACGTAGGANYWMTESMQALPGAMVAGGSIVFLYYQTVANTHTVYRSMEVFPLRVS